jgi:hypothetical protein
VSGAERLNYDSCIEMRSENTAIISALLLTVSEGNMTQFHLWYKKQLKIVIQR